VFAWSQTTERVALDVLGSSRLLEAAASSTRRSTCATPTWTPCHTCNCKHSNTASWEYAGETNEHLLRSLLLLSVNGGAAGPQNTG
jgi:hypothetical protein